MRLPTAISPNAIAQAVVAIYFDPAVPDDAIFGLVYQALRADFAKVTALPFALMPVEIRRKDPQLAFQPTHLLEGELLTVSVGFKSVIVASVKEYPGWQTLQSRFRSALAKIDAAGVIGRPTRFGLRYISFFPDDIFPNLTLSVDIDGQPLTGEGTQFRTILRAKKCQLLLQVSKDVVLQGETAKRGSVIDIDTFLVDPKVDDGLDVALVDFLDEAHTAQKELFFRLLKPTFLETLHPTYDSN